MNHDLLLVLFLLSASIGMLVVGKPRPEAVALINLLVLPLLGLVSVPQALAGFSDPNVILIALMFVVGEGLVRTGVAYRLGVWLSDRAGASESRVMVLLMLAVCGLGAFMSSTGVVAIFLPVALGIARRLEIHPGRLMMPLSFAGLLSGMQTLVATPPNMILDSALDHAGFEGFRFFSFTPIGLTLLVLGVAYMLLVRRRLAPSRATTVPSSVRRGFRELIATYRVEGRGHCLRLADNSPLIGHRLKELALRRNYHLNVLGVLRQGRFHQELLGPSGQLELQGGDILLVDFPGELTLPAELGLQEAPFRSSYFTQQSHEVGMAEVMLHPDSELLGKSIRQATFRTVHKVNVVGMRRGGVPFEGDYLEEPLKLADTLLVVGTWKSIRQLQSQHRDFVVLSLPAEADTAAPAHHAAPLALMSLAVMVALMVSGVVPYVLAALITCLMLGLFRCIDVESALKSVHWQSLLLIVGLMPFAQALQETGGVELGVAWLLSMVGDTTPLLLLGALFLMTTIVNLFISNTATAVLMAPVAVSLATQAGASAQPFAMTVAIAASAAFMTPVSSPVNTLVWGPGEYKFFDFVKVGVPFMAIVLIVTLLLVPWLFPFAAPGTGVTPP